MFSPTGLGQTVAVFDKSGKAVSTSKQILNVFREAKAAYQERKAEILAARRAAVKPQIRRAYTVDDVSVTSSRRSDRTHGTHRSSRYDEGRRASRAEPSRRHSETQAGDENHRKSKEPRVKVTPIDTSRSSPASPRTASPSTPLPPYSAQDPKPLVKAHTFHAGTPQSPGHLISPRRTQSSETIDMDLAYGEAPPNLMMVSKRHDDAELSGLVGRAKFLLDEAKCVQHSVTSTIANLQKNPEAMAAVALTLGEITTLVKKMSPGALMKIRVLAPSVFALLTSPQFLIAAGVGVGITVICLGGYKVIKKIRAKEEEETPEQMIALGSEVSRIESWRQGVADIEGQSVGTSVDGELITPMAANLSRLNLAEDERERRSSARSTGHRSSRSVKTVRTSRSGTSRAHGSRGDARSISSESTVKESRSSKDKDKKSKSKPRPSPLMAMFKP